ncbi:hypothetical protein [Vreelandella aquamarina]
MPYGSPSQRIHAKPETVADACAGVGVSCSFNYAAYWFSHGVPLADA